MRASPLLPLILICPLAVASTDLIDQIGPSNGTWMTGKSLPAQDFETAWDDWDVAVLEPIVLQEGQRLTEASCVIMGWGDWIGPEDVSGYAVDLYSTTAEAAEALIGDRLHIPLASGTELSFSGTGHLIRVDLDHVVAGGEAFLAITPVNDFDENGQTGVAGSISGDGQCHQANPGGSWGFGPLRTLPSNAAYRLRADLGDPCLAPLPESCAGDLNGDETVGILDLLAVLDNWGATGDGTFRPAGDCAPLPDGDCTVGILDLLTIIDQWNLDCRPRGACCAHDGTCQEDLLEESCDAQTATWLGEGSTCGGCIQGGCCLENGSCIDASVDGCFQAGGVFQGGGTDCASLTCIAVPENNTCDTAIEISDGTWDLDTRGATTTGEANFVQCPNGGNEQIHNDVFYTLATGDQCLVTVSTCGLVEFDSRIQVLKNGCDTPVTCNDDGDGCPWYTSEVTWLLDGGEVYTIRIGSFTEGDTGVGTFTLACDVPPTGACCLDESTCLDEISDLDCAKINGHWQGEDTTCDNLPGDGLCEIPQPPDNDTCDAAELLVDGEISFSNSNATDGPPNSDFFLCANNDNQSNNNDIWYLYEAPCTGVATFSTCSTADFDTRLQLYIGGCGALAQLACNDDGEGCIGYTSVLTSPVVEGISYWLRLGSYHPGPDGQGSGVLTVSCYADDTPGACCLGGECTGVMPQATCVATGGTWYVDETCDSITCPVPVTCDGSAVQVQQPTDPQEYWAVGGSDTTLGYIRYERLTDSVTSISGLNFWGVLLATDGSSYESCDAPDLAMEVTVLADDGSGRPSDTVLTAITWVPVQAPTGVHYGIDWESIRFDMPLSVPDGTPDLPGGWISIASTGDQCHFYWLSSGLYGEGSSLLGHVDWPGYFKMQGFDLSICIMP